jgi:parallel beta-helix repeat protein
VNLSHININGTQAFGPSTQASFPPCSSDYLGVEYNGATGSISNLSVSNVQQPAASFGCQPGPNGDIYAATGSTLAITKVSATAYDKNGITCKGSGTSCQITKATVTGSGPITTNAQNGIEIASSASATITSSSVTNNSYAVNTNSATGILGFQANSLTVGGAAKKNGNKISSNDINIADELSTTLNIQDNTVTAATDAALGSGQGIVLFFNSGGTVQGNTATGDAGDGIQLFATNGSTVSNNTASGNGPGDGINDTGGTSDNIQSNTAKSNANGISLTGAKKDNVAGNTAISGNAGAGIFLKGDGAGNPSNGSTVTNNMTTSNAGGGIIVAASVGSKILTNTDKADGTAGAAGGITFDSVKAATIQGNNEVSDLGPGIALNGSSGNTVTGNTASKDQAGLVLLGPGALNTVCGPTATSPCDTAAAMNRTVSDGQTAAANSGTGTTAKNRTVNDGQIAAGTRTNSNDGSMVTGGNVLTCNSCAFNLSDQSLSGDGISVTDGTNTLNTNISTVSGNTATLGASWTFAASSHLTVTITGQKLVYSASAAFNQADVGGTVTGTGIPAGTTILTVNGSTIATLNNQPTATSSTATITFSGTKNLLLASGGPFTSADVGMPITGTAIPAGTTVVSQTGTAAVLSNSPTAQGTNPWSISGTTVQSETAQFTAGDVGAAISGTGIPAGTKITAVASDGDSATMSAAATADGTGISITIDRSGELGVVGECTAFGVPLGAPCDGFIGGYYASNGNTISGNSLSGNQIGALAEGPGALGGWNGPALDEALNNAWYGETNGNQFGPPGNAWAGNTIEAQDGTWSGLSTSPTLQNTWDPSNSGNSGFTPCDPSSATNGTTTGC